MAKRRKIEIDFPVEVEITENDCQLISAVIANICERESQKKECLLWLFEQGSKVTYIPLTIEEEKEHQIEYDDDVEYFGVSMKDEKKT
jgi:hypothetical protein